MILHCKCCVWGSQKCTFFVWGGHIWDPLLVWFRNILRVKIWLMGSFERCAEKLEEIRIQYARNGLVNFNLLTNLEKCGAFLNFMFGLFIVRFRSILAMKWPFYASFIKNDHFWSPWVPTGVIPPGQFFWNFKIFTKSEGIYFW